MKAYFNGKPFWSGSVNLIDGIIEEVHTMEEAEDNDFHHSMYFSVAQVEKMDNEECGFFWFTDDKIHAQWRNSIEKDIISSIMKQIEIK